MADLIIVLILVALGILALRSCLKKKGGDGCSGGCGNCHGHCHQQNKRPRP